MVTRTVEGGTVSRYPMQELRIGDGGGVAVYERPDGSRYAGLPASTPAPGATQRGES
jgi:hypothetical protein